MAVESKEKEGGIYPLDGYRIGVRGVRILIGQILFYYTPTIFSCNHLLEIDQLNINFRESGPFCFCFPFWIGRIKITLFHFLLSCTIIFSLLWGCAIYSCINSALQDRTIVASQDNNPEYQAIMLHT